VTEALARTARVITAAALIMVAVFGAFALSRRSSSSSSRRPGDGDPRRRDRRAHGARAVGDAAARRAQLVAAALAGRLIPRMELEAPVPAPAG
jgi:hypothetical protein